MEITFKKTTLEDKAVADSFIRSSDRRFCEYTFGNMFCWGSAAGLETAIVSNAFILGYPDRQKFHMPVGSLADSLKATAALLECFPELTLISLSEEDVKALQNEFPERLSFSENPLGFDYIYESEKLRMLSGKKLAAKRNHINAFISDGEWSTRPITDDDTEVLERFNKKWCADLCGHMSGSLKTELCATQLGLMHFKELGFSGLMLYKNGELVAYSYGEPINSDTYCVHVEKADSEVRGAYQMINREFARTFCSDYKYVNREDDAGDSGLRRAKQSYCPTEIGRKFTAVLRRK